MYKFCAGAHFLVGVHFSRKPKIDRHEETSSSRCALHERCLHVKSIAKSRSHRNKMNETRNIVLSIGQFSTQRINKPMCMGKCGKTEANVYTQTDAMIWAIVFTSETIFQIITFIIWLHLQTFYGIQVRWNMYAPLSHSHSHSSVQFLLLLQAYRNGKNFDPFTGNLLHTLQLENISSCDLFHLCGVEEKERKWLVFTSVYHINDSETNERQQQPRLF